MRAGNRFALLGDSQRTSLSQAPKKTAAEPYRVTRKNTVFSHLLLLPLHKHSHLDPDGHLEIAHFLPA